MEELAISNKRFKRKNIGFFFMTLALFSFPLALYVSTNFFYLSSGLILISVYLFIKVKNTYIISYNQKLEKVLISNKKSKVITDLDNIKNIVEGAHFQPRNEPPHTNFYLYLLESIELGNEFIFTIYDHDKELLKNLAKLRVDIANVRHKRAKYYATLKK